MTGRIFSADPDRLFKEAKAEMAVRLIGRGFSMRSTAELISCNTHAALARIEAGEPFDLAVSSSPDPLTPTYSRMWVQRRFDEAMKLRRQATQNEASLVAEKLLNEYEVMKQDLTSDLMSMDLATRDKARGRVLQINAEIAKLTGANAPKQVEISHTVELAQDMRQLLAEARQQVEARERQLKSGTIIDAEVIERPAIEQAS